MNNNISSSDKINALPSPAAGKEPGVKRNQKALQAESTGVKIETDTYTHTGGDSRAIVTGREKSETAGTDEESGGLITAAEVISFVEAYNLLPDELGEDFTSVRAEVYRPLLINGRNRQISLYEIGVAHSPNNRRKGGLSVNKTTLAASIQERGADVHALFLQKNDGLLQRLCSLVRGKSGSERFLQVCEGIMDRPRF